MITHALQRKPLGLPGATLLEFPLQADDRGWFRKPFQRSLFRDLGLPNDFDEQFFSFSVRGVIRGLHHQLPPSDQWKLVVCLSGTIWDVTLDLRTASPMAREHRAVTLSADSPLAVLIPPGCAHGFLTQSTTALVGYWVTSEHDPDRDTGVRWDSAGVEWPFDGSPTVSVRDRSLPALKDVSLLDVPVLEQP